MDNLSKQSHTHLFTIQLWLEELGDGQSEWRGKLKNVANGEERYFRQWSVLGRLVQAMLPKTSEVVKQSTTQ